LRAPEGLDGKSGYIKVDAELTKASEPISTQGVVACHLCKVGDRVYAVNYLSGNLSLIGGGEVTHAPGEDHQPGRQDAPHPHCVIPTEDGKTLLCTDLGLDTVFVYDLDLKLLSKCKMPKGHGVRHLVAGRNGFYYAANELMSTVSVLKYDAEARELKCLSSYSCGISMEGNTAAAIRLTRDGKHLLVSHRGADTVSVFSVSDSGRSLALLHNIPCGGKDPRDMILTPDERFILCANQTSGDLTVLALDETMRAALTDRAALPQALCVLAE
jgi:6-phosphogluconolactonase